MKTLICLIIILTMIFMGHQMYFSTKPNRVTLENYNKLKAGMLPSDVRSFLGNPVRLPSGSMILTYDADGEIVEIKSEKGGNIFWTRPSVFNFVEHGDTGLARGDIGKLYFWRGENSRTIHAFFRNDKLTYWSFIGPVTPPGTLQVSSVSRNDSEFPCPPGFELVKAPDTDTYGWASEIRHKTTGIEMVYVAPGEFMMGCGRLGQASKNDFRHHVIITKGYYIGKYEVTQTQWQKVMGNNPSNFKNSVKNAPVESVSWNDCQDFCKRIGSGFRLPTEAEWEYAARGGKKIKGFTYSGSNNLDEVGWYNKNTAGTQSVAQKKSNEIGLYDMSGNVSEWCSDWYGEYPTQSIVDPVGPSSGKFRVIRGGYYFNHPGNCRSVSRNWCLPDSRYHFHGFRPVMDIPISEKKQISGVNISSSIKQDDPSMIKTVFTQESPIAPQSAKKEGQPKPETTTLPQANDDAALKIEKYQKKIDEAMRSVEIVKKQRTQAKMNYDEAVKQYNSENEDLQKRVSIAKVKSFKPPTSDSSLGRCKAELDKSKKAYDSFNSQIEKLNSDIQTYNKFISKLKITDSASLTSKSE